MKTKVMAAKTVVTVEPGTGSMLCDHPCAHYIHLAYGCDA